MLAVLVQSTLAVVLTSIVPLVAFFAMAPFLADGKAPSLLLTTLVSLAVGSLLGDVFYHLIPEIFELETRHFIAKSTWMLIGVFLFFLGERILQRYHRGHGHSHLPLSRTSPTNAQRLFVRASSTEEMPSLGEEEMELTIMSTCKEERVLSRTSLQDSDHGPTLDGPSPTSPFASQVRAVKPVGLLVLTSDFIHNFVDGLAIGISFASSFSIGLSTALAVFLHEIPHELGDFVILLSAGYQPGRIVLYNVLASLSSLGGVLLALAMVQFNGEASGADSKSLTSPLLTTLKPAVLAMTAGNFLYIALADLVPELLHAQNEEERTRWWGSWMQHFAFLLGILSMLFIKLVSD